MVARDSHPAHVAIVVVVVGGMAVTPYPCLSIYAASSEVWEFDVGVPRTPRRGPSCAVAVAIPVRGASRKTLLPSCVHGYESCFAARHARRKL